MQPFRFISSFAEKIRMMGYTELYQSLKSEFLSEKCESKVLKSGVIIHCFQFESDADQSFCGSLYPSDHQDIFSKPDSDFEINKVFKYMIFDPGNGDKYDQAILLMHGLNERYWFKYLTWAHEMALSMNRPVILFPLAFHINRSPEDWNSRFVLSTALPLRMNETSNDHTTTVANLALSNRLSKHPIRFLTSGKQSADDIVKLVQNIRNGEHPLFNQNAVVDIFAYSIGGFLAQVLFYSNRNLLFEKSKLFLFCAGSYFDEMYGVSRVIMDKTAFEIMYRYYTVELNNDCKRNANLENYLKYNTMGIAFYAMLSKQFNYNYNRNINSQIGRRIKAYALKEDKVIPANAIKNTLEDNIPVIIDDFPFEYIHENPFPLYHEDDKIRLVDEAFNKVFSEVKEFFAA